MATATSPTNVLRRTEEETTGDTETIVAINATIVRDMVTFHEIVQRQEWRRSVSPATGQVIWQEIAQKATETRNRENATNAMRKAMLRGIAGVSFLNEFRLTTMSKHGH